MTLLLCHSCGGDRKMFHFYKQCDASDNYAPSRSLVSTSHIGLAVSHLPLLSSVESHMVESEMFPPIKMCQKQFLSITQAEWKVICRADFDCSPYVDFLSSSSSDIFILSYLWCRSSVQKIRKALPVIVSVCVFFFPLWILSDDDRGWPRGALSMPNLRSITPLQCSPHNPSAELNGEGLSRRWTLHWAGWPVAHFSHLPRPCWNKHWAWLITLKNKWDVGGL